MSRITFFVPGKAQPGGSKRFYGKGRVVDDNPKAANWKNLVALVARQETDGTLLHGPLSVTCIFHIVRPKNHYRTGKNAHILRDDAPPYPITKPDATKLWRSTEDALTGVIWNDDAQVVEQIISKIYSPTPGAHIAIEPILEENEQFEID